MAIAVRRAELLRACDGDETQLELVLRLLSKNGGGAAVKIEVPAPRLIRDPPAPPIRRERAVRAAKVAVRTAEPAVAPKACDHGGRRAPRYATSMRDLEENPGDFLCTDCGRILDGPENGVSL